METTSSQWQPRSFWVSWVAWILVLAVLVWSFGIDFFLSELKMLSFVHMIIWAIMLLLAGVLFLVSVISSVGDLLQARRTGNLIFKKKLIGRIVISSLGLVASPILIFIYGLLVFTVGSNF